MSAIKKLAGHTLIYGVSSILGRLINYLLVWLHTDTLKTSEYGVYIDIYAYVAFFVVIYTFGMETTFFRFVNKEDSKYTYKNAASAVFYFSLTISSLLILFADPIASLLGYPGKSQYIIWLAIILFIDALVAIPFARLRQENKPMRFAFYRLSNIFIVVFLQIFFLWACPKIHAGEMLTSLKPFVDSFYRPDYGVSYIIIANLIANSFYVLFLYKYILQIGFKIHWASFKSMLVYALPILITGLAGIINEKLDIIMLGDYLPEGFYPEKSNSDIQGIYGASVKLSFLMLLGFQAFRYAAEPFFFSKAKDKDAPALFAKVMRYFIIVCVIVFIGVSLNKELIGSVLLRSPEFRQALFIVPFLLMAKLLFGIYTNLAIWFKLTDKTIYGTYFSVIGAIITIVGNMILIPKLGYVAPAYVGIFTYFIMTAICYYYGQKYYPIPYQIKSAIAYILSGVVFVFLISQIHLDIEWQDYGLKLFATFLYIVIVYVMEKKNLNAKTV